MVRCKRTFNVLGFLCLAVAVTAASATEPRHSVSTKPLSEILLISKTIDGFIESGYTHHKIKPNVSVGHEAFLRRIYLGIIGRIPTYDETTSFLTSRGPDKRSNLIDSLLDSEGYISHQFNYWADVLRVKTRLTRAPGQPYVDWVKQALRENKPYDKLVFELITAEGYMWENGAAGFYQRDFAMPLDNMSNAARIFLGMRLGCAQCHDHPFELWTQHEYYEMAAFTYGVKTQKPRKHLDENLKAFVQLIQQEDRWTRRAGNDLIGSFRYVVYDDNRPLRLPDNYRYDDAAPNAIVHPKTIFGDDAMPTDGQHRRHAYARWLTSAANPKFTMVIANRLWKQVMGIGLVEPVDSLENGYEQASNPDLLKYLEKQLSLLDYDMKQYLRVLYNTKTYQRRVSHPEWKVGEPYHFPGPILRRMSAEQIWDSMLNLAIEDLDKRKNKIQRQLNVERIKELQSKDPQELLAMARERGVQLKDDEQARTKMREVRMDLEAARRANNMEQVNNLTKQQKQLRRSRNRQRVDMSNLVISQQEEDANWEGFPADMVRASELQSPAPPGHFLRRFGQSDREIIDNSSDEATVTQILNMLNGPLFSRLMKANSLLARQVREKTSTRDKLQVIFLSIYNRKPTALEMRTAMLHVRTDDSEGFGNVAWALMNTRQFIFIE